MSVLHHKVRRAAIAHGKALGVASFFATDKGKPLFPPVGHPVGAARQQRDARLRAPAADDRITLGRDAKSNYTGASGAENPRGFEQKSAAARQASRYDLQDVARRLLPGSRVSNCQRLRAAGGVGHDKADGVHVLRSASGGCHFTGLQTCGSVWVCPVCAAKISEHRRIDVATGIQRWRDHGGVVSLLTLTAPHWVGDDLVRLLKSQALALTRFWSDRHVRRIFVDLGVVGQVRALELTYGANGWHPHYHCLVFGERMPELDQLVELYERWAHCCVKAGLGAPSAAHGLRWDDGSYADKYVSKWGLEHEVTKGHIKQSKGGQSPFDFLRAAQQGDRQAGDLFKVYAAAFKGKRQLFYSRGLRVLLGLGAELTDAEAVEQAAPGELVGRLTWEQWRYFCRLGLRGRVLEVAAVGGWSAVVERWRWPFALVSDDLVVRTWPRI